MGMVDSCKSSVIVLFNKLTLSKVMFDSSVSDRREDIPSSLQLFLSKQRPCVLLDLFNSFHKLIIVVFGSLCAAGTDDITTCCTDNEGSVCERQQVDGHCLHC